MARTMVDRFHGAGMNGTASHLVAKPHVWTALSALHSGFPAPVVVDAVKPILNSHAEPVVEALEGLMATPAIGEVVATIQTHGIRMAMGTLANGSPARHFDDAERMLAGVRFVHSTIRAGLPIAAAASHDAGVEVEFDPLGLSNDEIYEAIKKQLAAQGLSVSLKREAHAVRFHIDADDAIYAVIQQRFTHNGRTVEVIRSPAAGDITLVYLREIVDGEPVWTKLKSMKGSAAMVEEKAFAMAAKVLGLRGAEEIRRMEADPACHQRFDILMMKATRPQAAGDEAPPDDAAPKGGTSEFALLRLEQTALNQFTVTPLNGAMRGTENSRQLQLAANSVDAVVDVLRARAAADPEWIAKTDTITGLQIEGMRGPFRLVYEQWPFRELITPRLRPEEFPLLEQVLGALAGLHVMGTTDHAQIGVHVHGNMPRKVRGRFSVMPFLNVARSAAGYMPQMLAAIPSHPTRRPFIRPMRASLRRRILQNDYVADPETLSEEDNIGQNLCVMADFVLGAPPKYSLLNFDKIIAVLAEEMLSDPALSQAILAVGRKFTRTWHGRRYTFAIVPDKKNGPDILVTHRGQTQSLLRVKPGLRTATAEFRGFNTSHRVHRQPGQRPQYTIDVASIMLYTRFVSARTAMDGAEPFI
ncbi:MAG: amidoligase family protein [Deltaproteobacteria bacterium]|nr:amidoligase family protein [Deltaproteobacteria bacterium]